MNRVALACVLSFATGFLSLSQEILYVRLVGFAYHSTPEAFAFVLACFLLGIALGASVGKRICAGSMDLVQSAGVVLLGAAILDACIPWLAATLLESLYAVLPLAMLIVVTSALKSVLFPIVHELGADAGGARVGRSISRVYASNIAGSTLGPLVTGFWLLDHVPLEHAFLLISAGTLALALIALGSRSVRNASQAALVGIPALAIALAVPASMLNRIIERDMKPGQSLASVIEHRSGIVHTVSSEPGGDIVYGGNVYDGRINTSLVVNSNGIDRVYLMSLLHPRPERVLVIGMSTGAWARVITSFPAVRHVDVIEINPAYLELVGRHDAVRPLLTDSRIAIHIDDGRRWLKRRPEAAYDLIAMNVTLHWRSYATNLLSREFLTTIRQHLRDGGLFVFNTTGSPDAVRTAMEVFPYVRLFNGSAYCAESAFVVNADPGTLLYALRQDGAPLLREDNASDRKAVQELVSARLIEPAMHLRHVGRPAEIVTDDNMITEYRHGLRGRLVPQID